MVIPILHRFMIWDRLSSLILSRKTRASRQVVDRAMFCRFRLMIAFVAIAVAFPNPVRSLADDIPALVEELPEADQMTFAESLEQAVKNSDIKTINGLIDWNQILETATAGGSTPAIDRARADFKASFMKAVIGADKGTYGEQVIQNSKDGGSYKFLRLSLIENQPIAVFRLKTPGQGGANYHQYFLKRSPDGLVRAQDLYIFLSAEKFSETIRKIWQPVSIEVSKSLIERLTKPADPVLMRIQSIQLIHKLNSNGQYDQALNEYRKLPEKTQQEKFALILRLRSAQQVSQEEYGNAIDDYRKYHPGDPALDFILIDGYALQKNFEKSIECIDRTNQAVGGDALLLTWRANALVQLKRFDDARESVGQAIKQEPDLLDGYFSGLGIALAQNRYSEIVEYLTTLEKDLGQKITDLTKVPEYAEFVKSPEYQKWMDSRK